jgi:hypothetical protein
MKLKTLALCAVGAPLLASCMVKNGNDGFMVIEKVIQATSSGGNANCTYSPDTLESTFGRFNPAAGGYTHGLVIENRLPDNSNGTGRLNTNDFQVEGADVTYEQVDGPQITAAMPTQTVPGNGLILVGTKGVTQLELITPAIVTAMGTTNAVKLRVSAQIFGRLLDGSKVHTNTYEYVVQSDPTFALASPCTGTQTAIFCEGGGLQDTGVVCK